MFYETDVKMPTVALSFNDNGEKYVTSRHWNYTGKHWCRHTWRSGSLYLVIGAVFCICFLRLLLILQFQQMCIVLQTCLPVHIWWYLYRNLPAIWMYTCAYFLKYGQRVSRKYENRDVNKRESVASKGDHWALMELLFVDICMFQAISRA